MTERKKSEASKLLRKIVDNKREKRGADARRYQRQRMTFAEIKEVELN